jgi:quercetin dioxygenase-like cupin family protein
MSGRVVTEPVVCAWEQQRQTLDWGRGDRLSWGRQCGVGPEVRTEGHAARTVVAPFGQRWEVEQLEGDAVLICVEGEFEVTVDDQHVALKPLDMLGVAGGSHLVCQAVSLIAATLMAAIGSGHARVGFPAPTALVSWEEQRRAFSWGLPWAHEWGYHRGSGPHLMSGQTRCHVMQIGPGQASPWHYSGRDLIIYPLSGEVRFECADRIWDLAPRDLFRIPYGTPYAFSNLTLEQAVFFDVGRPAPKDRPGKYFTSDPGWPIRGDAATLDTKFGREGELTLVTDAGADNR